MEPVYCGNDRCPKYRDTGRRHVIGKRSSDTVGTIENHCVKCRQYTVTVLGSKSGDKETDHRGQRNPQEQRPVFPRLSAV